MKFVLNSLLLLLSAACFSNYAYSVKYDADKHCPVYVAYSLAASDLADARRPAIGFKPDPEIPGSPTEKELDFPRHDKGHCCAADDREADPKKLKQTFFTSNVMLQIAALNRGGWKALEYQLRKLARAGETLFIVTGPWFAADFQRTPSGVAIPSACFKAVRDSAGNWRGWIFPNTSSARGPPAKFEVNIETLQLITGLEFETIYKQEKNK